MNETKVIIFLTSTDYVKRAYFDLKNVPSIGYYEHNIARALDTVFGMYKLKAPSFVYRPCNYLQGIKSLDCKARNIIVYHGTSNIPLIKQGFPQYAKCNYNAKNVGIFWDVFDFEKMNIDFLKKQLDMIIVPDKSLAEKYEITYYPLFYCKDPNILYQTKSKRVFFCGENGGRVELLRNIARKLNDYGIQHKFFISNSKHEYTDDEGIHYITRMSHDTYIEMANKSSILLDVVKSGSRCCSLRFCEAVAYGIKLLTNNQVTKEMQSYDPGMVSIFNNAEDIDLSFIKSDYMGLYPYPESISPFKFVDFLKNSPELF